MINATYELHFLGGRHALSFTPSRFEERAGVSLRSLPQFSFSIKDLNSI